MTPAGSSSGHPERADLVHARESFHGLKPATVDIPASGNSALTRISNIPLQSYCHAIVTNNELWMAAAGWGIVVFLVGIVFFWQAEALYGRG